MIVLQIDIETPEWAGLEAVAQRAGDAALARWPDREGEAALLLTDDGRLQALNGQFRGKDAPTNVLAFPAPANPEGSIGDIAVAYGVCRSEAAEQGKSLADHLSHLVIHGALHLMGYDHMTEAEAEAMEALERELLAGLGVPDPYDATYAQGDHVQHGP